MRFRQTQFPRQTGMLNARLWRRSGTPIMAANEDDIGMALGDPGGNGANAHLGDQFDTDAGVVVGVFEIVDQLRQILDRIDVVMRRGRDEPNPRG